MHIPVRAVCYIAETKMLNIMDQHDVVRALISGEKEIGPWRSKKRSLQQTIYTRAQYKLPDDTRIDHGHNRSRPTCNAKKITLYIKGLQQWKVNMGVAEGQKHNIEGDQQNSNYVLWCHGNKMTCICHLLNLIFFVFLKRLFLCCN